MSESTSQYLNTAGEALSRLPGPEGQRFAVLFEHGSLALEIYAPRGNDPQQPHTRDESTSSLREVVNLYVERLRKKAYPEPAGMHQHVHRGPSNKDDTNRGLSDG